MDSHIGQYFSNITIIKCDNTNKIIGTNTNANRNYRIYFFKTFEMKFS